MNLLERSPGAIRDGTGFATFTVNFEALVFRPFKDEVLPAYVDVVNKVSMHCIQQSMSGSSGSNIASTDGSANARDLPWLQMKWVLVTACVCPL